MRYSGIELRIITSYPLKWNIIRAAHPTLLLPGIRFKPLGWDQRLAAVFTSQLLFLWEATPKSGPQPRVFQLSESCFHIYAGTPRTGDRPTQDNTNIGKKSDVYPCPTWDSTIWFHFSSHRRHQFTHSSLNLLYRDKWFLRQVLFLLVPMGTCVQPYVFLFWHVPSIS